MLEHRAMNRRIQLWSEIPTQDWLSGRVVNHIGAMNGPCFAKP